MNPANISLLNAIVLITLGLWGYLGSETPSPTALIPVGFGGLLLAMNPGVRKNNKVIAHVAVVFTLLILLGLVMPLKGSIERGDSLAIIRVVVMIASTVLAMVAFVQSFVATKRAKTLAAQQAGVSNGTPPGTNGENSSTDSE